MALLALDFEYNESNEPILNLVCAATQLEGEPVLKWPLYKNQKHKSDLYNYLQSQKNHTLISYAATAESRSLIALGLKPLEFSWIDSYAEFRMLCNSNNKFNHGHFITDKGEVGFSIPPIPKEEVEEDTSSTPKNLINYLFKLLGVRADSQHKDKMRDIILSRKDDLILAHYEEIMEYCASDVKYLIPAHKKLCEIMDETFSGYEVDMLRRGTYSASTGIVENIGIPINDNLLHKIIEKTEPILKTAADDVNKFFPYFLPEYQKPDLIIKKGQKYQRGGKLVTATKDIHYKYKVQEAKKDNAAYQKYVESLGIKDFPKTDTGKYKADKDTLEEWGYWEGLEALWKYNKLESSLKWFRKDNKNGFFDNYGSDCRVRPYFGVFGTQTGRNAAKAKTFPLAMSAWLRIIVQPPKGYALVVPDYEQQEVYIAAILSGDLNLLNAYLSGDVYLAFGKQTGLIPPDGTKATHKKERVLFKSTVLGKQFGMGVPKLHTKLKLDSKNKDLPYSTAEQMDRYHKQNFKAYWAWVDGIAKRYRSNLPLVTSDGWVLWQDNPVLTSVKNFLVQGHAASMTRWAQVEALKSNFDVIYQLHDAFGIQCRLEEVDHVKEQIKIIMQKAACQTLNEAETNIRIDFKVITHDTLWVEEKGEEDVKKLKPLLDLD